MEYTASANIEDIRPYVGKISNAYIRKKIRACQKENKLNHVSLPEKIYTLTKEAVIAVLQVVFLFTPETAEQTYVKIARKYEH